MVGAHTLADCMRLPRAGMARRFGRALLDELGRALGKLPEVREFFVPPPSFERRLELPAQVNEAEGLLFAARRLLPELEGYLNLRQAGVQEFELVCCHEDVRGTVVKPRTVLKLGFVQPTRAADRMQLLLRETLGRTRLPAPVHTIVLSAKVILPLEVSNADLFQDSAETGEGNLLLERLRIRLGKEAVFGIAPVADHRPERAWRIHSDINLLREPASESRGARHPHVLPVHSGVCAPGSSDVDPLATISAAMYKSPAIRQRPLWLLPKPLRCEEGRFVSRSSPERIESGWWDGMDVERDYYVVQDRNGSRLWVYCERGSGEWFVHGLFA
jgi:protein ImuB